MIQKSARGVARRAALIATAVIGLMALTGTTVSAAPSAAPETAALAAAPCGLSGAMKAHPAYGWNWYNYTIRNCHDYAVWRLVDVTNSISRDGYCHFIRAGGTISSRMEVNTLYDTVLGLKAC